MPIDASFDVSTLVPSPDDLAFAVSAMQMGSISAGDVHECLKLQSQESKDGQPRRRLREILLERGLLNTDEAIALSMPQQSASSPDRFGPYIAESVIAEGGMGIVYKAKHVLTGQYAAIKILPDSMARSKDLLVRFRREAEINSKMNHPNIVRTVGMGEARGKKYIAMEYVEGQDLGRILSKEGLLKEHEALNIIHAVATALAHAHELGLVHRDVKPSNILLAKDGTVKLTDFGLVKDTDPNVTAQTQTGQVLGTPNYISPEQARGDAVVDHRSDIYSLGATLYHMVTGQPPFISKSPVGLLTMHLHDNPTPPYLVNPQVSNPCARIIDKMLQKKPEDRYQSPSNLVEDIELVISGEEPAFAAAAEPAHKSSGMKASESQPYLRIGLRVPLLQEASDISQLRVSPMLCFLIGTAMLIVGALLAGQYFFDNSTLSTAFFVVIVGIPAFAAGIVIGAHSK